MANDSKRFVVLGAGQERTYLRVPDVLTRYKDVGTFVATAGVDDAMTVPDGRLLRLKDGDTLPTDTGAQPIAEPSGSSSPSFEES